MCKAITRQGGVFQVYERCRLATRVLNEQASMLDTKDVVVSYLPHNCILIGN